MDLKKLNNINMKPSHVKMTTYRLIPLIFTLTHTNLLLSSISNSIITNNEELNKRIVRTVTIDSLVETINIDAISLLKMDVEGPRTTPII
jgi:FkbM family methyltransferase